MKEKFNYAALLFPPPNQPQQRPPTFELDCWAECRTPEFDAFTTEVAERMQATHPMKRWHESRTLILRLMLCNLIQNHHRLPGRGTRFYRSPRFYSGKTRYRPDFISGKVLPGVVDALEAARLISFKAGEWDPLNVNSTMSQAAPKPKLVALWTAFGVSREMITASQSKPSIELRSIKRRMKPRGQPSYDLIEYPRRGTEASARLFFASKAVETINSHLSRYALGLPEEARKVGEADQDQWLWEGGRWLKLDAKAALRWVDLSDTHLTRIFNNVDPATYDLDQGGRFYGAWWQAIRSDNRTQITIDDGPTVELDYGSFHPRMIYHQAGIDRRDDLYALPALSDAAPDFDQMKLRKAVKTLWLIALNSSNRQLGAARRADWATLTDDWDVELPEHIHPSAVIDMILEAHPEIRDAFGKGVGPRLQAIDSEICKSILLDGVRRKMPILPVHDSFIVRSADEKDLRAMMIHHYRARLRFDPTIDRKGPLVADTIDQEASKPAEDLEEPGTFKDQVVEWPLELVSYDPDIEE